MKTKLEQSIAEIAKDRQIVIEKLVQFSLTDMLLFWGTNKDLAQRQEKLWSPILIWAKENLDTKFNITKSINVPEQDSESSIKLKMFLEALDDKELTCFYYAALNTRSILLAAALIKRKINAQQAFEASCLEELWQAEQWGQDEAAENRRKSLLEELKTIESFIK